MQANTPVFELKDIRRRFAQTAAIDGVSLAVQRGEILGLIGRSGAGKSTLIRCLNGLETIDSGEILFDGQTISHLSESGWRTLRRHIGIIFQHFNLLSSRNILDNVALPLKLMGAPKKQRHNRAMELLELVGIADKAFSYPARLSGGQKQRVGIARALASNPSVLLCDEATSALDPETTRSILELLEKINRQMNITILLITHEMDVIRNIAQRVIVLDHGKIVEQGPVKDIFARPQTPTTQSLLQVITPSLPVAIAAKLDPVSGTRGIVALHISGAQACTPFLNDLATQTGMAAQIVQGGIDTIQGEAVGKLFLAIDATDRKKFTQAVEWLARHSDKSEVLGFTHD